MAIYECQCTKCYHEFETFTNKPTDKIDNCPKCGSKAKKLISKGSFVLVGGGWYNDGYSKNKEV